jgi:excisionase family DNA binding protein
MGEFKNEDQTSPHSNGRRFLTIAAAADYLSCTQWAVRSAIWDGQLAFVKIGRRHLIEVCELDRFADSLERQREGK